MYICGIDIPFNIVSPVTFNPPDIFNTCVSFIYVKPELVL